MVYQKAIEEAGATVHHFEQFGSYQGDWWAKVTYEGQTGWVHGSYGSCSGCDAFEGEFGYDSHECGNDNYYDPMYSDDGFREGCETCQALKVRVAEFGRGYLDNIMTQEEAIASASENLEWDCDAKEMVEYLKSH